MSNPIYDTMRYAFRVDKKTLRQRRFKVFVNQFGDAENQRHGWKSELARRIKKTPSAVSQYAAGTLKAETDTIQIAIEAFGIDPAFFSDPGLGESPNYSDFIGKKSQHAVALTPSKHASMVAESRTEYTGTDDYPTAAMREAFLETATGRKTDPDDMPAIFGKRYHGGATLGRMMDFAATILAERRGTAVHEPKQDTPIAENHMPLKPGRKGR